MTVRCEPCQRSYNGIAMNSPVGSDKHTNLWRVIHAAWIVLALAAFGMFVASLPAYTLRAIGAQTDTVYDAPPAFVRVIILVNVLASIAAALTSLGLAFILFRRKPRDPMAMYVSFYLLAYGVVAAGPLGMLDGSRPMTESAAILAEVVLLTTPTITLFFIFPTGQFVPRWTRWASVLSVVFIGAGVALVRHPPSAFDFWSLSGLLLMIFAWTCFAFYAPIYRYRRVSNLAERQQTKWVVFGMAMFLLLTALTTIPYFITQAAPRDTPQPLWAFAIGPVWWLSLNILPLSLTIAVMRYRLFDIDIIINRTLVYGALTLSTMVLYIFTVGYLGNLVQVRERTIIAFLTTGLVALIFQPMRERLQRLVNRLVYGDRDDPYSVLTRLGQKLEGVGSVETTLPTIVETIAQALKLPYVAIEFKAGDGSRVAAAYGTPQSGAATKYPLVYQNESFGDLVLAQRSGSDSFTPNEGRLLADLAREVEVAAHNVRLTADLQRSRQELVTGREEERRRIRRDLHDEIGPMLASQSLTLDAIEKLIAEDPAAAASLVRDLKGQAQGAVQEIRRIIYDLRPPTLDDLGLVETLRERFAQLGQSRLKVVLDATEDIPSLSAAVETAVYRIAVEAVTNVIRHADARECYVHLRVDGDLQLEIRDDGSWLQPKYRAGVGLRAMQERAEELGGTFRIERGLSKGTRLIIVLPLEKA